MNFMIQRFNSSKKTPQRFTKNHSIKLAVVLCISSVLFTLFFASGVIWRTQPEIRRAHVFTTVEMSRTLTFTPQSYTFSPNQNTLEIFLKVDDLANAFRSEFSVSVVARTSAGHVPTSAIISYHEYDNMIIRAEGVPRNFNGIQLRIFHTNAENLDERNYIVLRFTDEDVYLVEDIPIRTMSEYRIFLLEFDIHSLEMEKQYLDDSIVYMQENIYRNEQDILVFLELILTQTPEEVERIQRQITQRQNEISNLQSRILQAQNDRQDLYSRLQALQFRLSEMEASYMVGANQVRTYFALKCCAAK